MLTGAAAPPRSQRQANNLTVYSYLYSGNFTNITPRYWLGGMHSCWSHPVVFFFPQWKRSVLSRGLPSRHPHRLRHAQQVPWQLDGTRVADQLLHARRVLHLTLAVDSDHFEEGERN